jgi:hypothetical protein
MLFWWVAANLIIVEAWTVYCLWPRRRFTIPEHPLQRL